MRETVIGDMEVGGHGPIVLPVLHRQHAHAHKWKKNNKKPTYNTQAATYADKKGQIRECLTNPPESGVEEETEISCCV